MRNLVSNHSVPRVAAMLRATGFSMTEATACIRDYRRGYNWSSEAVNVSGGTRSAITRAFQHRHKCTQSRIHMLYRAAVEADNDWSDALAARYGKEACNARYDERGKATPELQLLARDKSKAMAAYRRAAFEHARGI